jgi:hypothetical protein
LTAIEEQLVKALGEVIAPLVIVLELLAESDDET